MERDARTVAAALFALIATIPPDPVQTVELRRGREVMCGDCGVSTSIFDTCTWCGGFAVPIATTNVRKGETNMAVKRPTEPISKVKKIKVKK